MRDSYYDVTAEDAIDLVLSDSKKEKDAREEDAEFIRRLRVNEPVRFGARDWDQQGRFDRAAKREQEQQQRRERENERQRVRYQYIDSVKNIKKHKVKSQLIILERLPKLVF